jgi:arylsulfatase
MGDDVGYWNISAYHQGIMGYQTPNIDRLAREGGQFMSYYAQQSCTAGRSAFITGQFGKNHLGDKDEFLPTNHGFDEFFGNLYHLNAEEEPENPDYPSNPEFKKRFGPRGVIRSFADGRIEDTGPLDIKRMETIDEEVLGVTKDFLARATKSGKPFFCWFNTTRMHNFTHVKKENLGKTGLGFYADGMVEHDALVGDLLKYVDSLGITEDTIVIYLTDNGPMVCLYPDSGTTPFRGEKNTNWEGGWRTPALVRWPGKIKPGTKFEGIFAGEDWLPTLLAAAGVEDIQGKLLQGYQAGNKKFKVYLDGYDQTDYLTGKSDKSARNEFFYFSDDGDLLAVRVDRLKVHFLIQEATGIDVWRHPFTKLRAPIFFDLKVDPGERAQEGMGYDEWWYRRSIMAVPMQNTVGRKLMTFKDFPPTPSASVAGATLRDSKMQWRKEPSRLKADAPNILIVLIDDVSLAYTFENGQATSQKTTQYFENNGSRGIYHSGWYACAFGPFLPWDTPASVPVPFQVPSRLVKRSMWGQI